MVHPRPLDKFVWVQRTDGSGKQKIILRSELPSHLQSERWERIYDPTKKTVDEPESSESVPAAKKAAKKQPAKPDSEKE